MIHRVQLEQSEFAKAPQKFEAGTSPLAAISGLNAGLDFLQDWPQTSLHQYEQQLLQRLHQQLQSINGINLLSSATNNIGLISLGVKEPDNYSLTDLSHWLDEQQIAVRAGHLCCQPLFDKLGTTGALRLSLGAYNNLEEIDKTCNAIEDFFDNTDLSILLSTKPKLNTTANPIVSTDSTNSIKPENNPTNHQSNKTELLKPDDLSQLSLTALTQAQGWQKKYRILMQWSQAIEAKPALRKEEFLIHGCESAAWMHQLSEDTANGRQIVFFMDSESRLIKGIQALILLHIQHLSPDKLQLTDLTTILKNQGLDRHLTSSRINGVHALLENIKLACDQHR